MLLLVVLVWTRVLTCDERARLLAAWRRGRRKRRERQRLPRARL